METLAVRQDDLLSSIGKTPLICLSNVTRECSEGAKVYAKAEHLNPGGSIKDRAALSMILAGERSGQLSRDKVILDATSGNTGIAYAMIGAALRYRVKLCIPKNAGQECLGILHAYGAELVLTDPLKGTDGAHVVASELAQLEPEKYFYPDQYNNSANWRAHYEGTGVEIWEQTDGHITHFLAGMGTSGTFVGTTRRLKQFNPAIRAVSMQPDSPFHGLEGMRHMQTSIVPGIYDPTLADAMVEVATEDAQEMTRRLARDEGLFVGVSSGANVFAALQLAPTLPQDALVVTVLCDGGSKYLGDAFWKE